MRRKKYRHHGYSRRLINELIRLTKEYSIKEAEPSKIESNDILLYEQETTT